jgi:hypothetical protein
VRRGCGAAAVSGDKNRPSVVASFPKPLDRLFDFAQVDGVQRLADLLQISVDERDARLLYPHRQIIAKMFWAVSASH